MATMATMTTATREVTFTLPPLPPNQLFSVTATPSMTRTQGTYPMTAIDGQARATSMDGGYNSMANQFMNQNQNQYQQQYLATGGGGVAPRSRSLTSPARASSPYWPPGCPVSPQADPRMDLRAAGPGPMPFCNCAVCYNASFALPASRSVLMTPDHGDPYMPRLSDREVMQSPVMDMGRPIMWSPMPPTPEDEFTYQQRLLRHRQQQQPAVAGIKRSTQDANLEYTAFRPSPPMQVQQQQPVAFATTSPAMTALTTDSPPSTAGSSLSVAAQWLQAASPGKGFHHLTDAAAMLAERQRRNAYVQKWLETVPITRAELPRM